MELRFNNRNFWQRLLGTPATPLPEAEDCYQYSDGKLVIDLSKVPELKPLDGAIRLEGNSLPVRVLVVHGIDGVYRAYKNQCTHFGRRRLDPVPGTDTVQCCSVNKSTFTMDGVRVCGPASGGITSYPVERHEEKLTVFISA